MKILDDVTDEEIKSLEIPTGVPLVYELNEDMKPVRHFHVGYCAFNIGHLSAEGCASASCCSISEAVLQINFGVQACIDNAAMHMCGCQTVITF